jgi:hypothetical protein
MGQWPSSKVSQGVNRTPHHGDIWSNTLYTENRDTLPTLINSHMDPRGHRMRSKLVEEPKSPTHHDEHTVFMEQDHRKPPTTSSMKPHRTVRVDDRASFPARFRASHRSHRLCDECAEHRRLKHSRRNQCTTPRHQKDPRSYPY